MSTLPTLRIHLLGAFRVAVDARPVPEAAWRSTRASALVKLLALAPHYRLHREQVMETLWPDLDLGAQANNLNVAASRARQALTSVGAPPGMFVSRLGETLVLGPSDAVWVDVVAFEEAVAAAWRRDDPVAFRAALALSTGDLLVDDPYEEWVEARRAAIRSSLLALLTRLGRLHEARGELGYAIEAYQRLVAIEPAHEEASVALMQLYAGQGQRTLAVAEFDRLAEALRRDLDAMPERTTTELAEAIREGRLPELGEPSTQREQLAEHALPLAPDNLPEPLDELVGREQERAEVGQVLASGRCVTLTGPGGIGKTRLAIAVGHDARGAFPDGVVFVDLAPIRDPDLVVAAIAHTLGVRDPTGRSPIDGLVVYLRDKAMLLVLDNFEQVADSAPVVRILLERAPRSKVLVTSRTRLRMSGEREYPVPPLAVPPDLPTLQSPEFGDAPAITLFVHRAQGIKPDFRLTAENAPAIADVCRRLDGLPLAIQLAAARVKVLTPQAMVTRLDHPLALLVGGHRDLPDRQQTIRRTIAWSYDLLSLPEQRLFYRSSCFVGGWTLEAAEDVVDTGDDLGIDVLDGLSSLVDKNLVVQREWPSGVRFGMLETVREYGLERLAESGDEARLRDRHAAHFVALAERAQSHLEAFDQGIWLDHLERDEGNLRSALAWINDRGDAELGLRLVSALRQYWFIRGRIAEGRDHILDIVALPGSAEFPALRADALNGIGFLVRDGDAELAAWACGESREIARGIDDRKREADALANLGYLALQHDDLAEAEALFRACLDINQMLDNAQGIADAVSFLALTAYHRNDLETARRLNEESLDIWESLDDRQGVVWARTHLAGVLLRQGEVDRAFAELVTSLAIARELDFRWGLSWSFDGLAQLASQRGAIHVAASLAAAAAAVREDSGLQLAPAEQAEIDHLRHRLEAVVVADALAAARSAKSWRSPDTLVRAVRDTLGTEVIEGVGASPHMARLDRTSHPL